MPSLLTAVCTVCVPQGLSCQDCDVGYTRSDGGLYLGTCTRCDCNGRSDECHPEDGTCMVSRRVQSLARAGLSYGRCLADPVWPAVFCQLVASYGLFRVFLPLLYASHNYPCGFLLNTLSSF